MPCPIRIATSCKTTCFVAKKGYHIDSKAFLHLLLLIPGLLSFYLLPSKCAIRHGWKSRPSYAKRPDVIKKHSITTMAGAAVAEKDE